MKKIILVAGDPNSINSEVIFKCWTKINNSVKSKIYLIANYKLILKQFKKLKYSIQIVKVKNILESDKNNKLKVIDIDLKFKNPFKITSEVASKYVKRSLTFAHKLALENSDSGIINCAINKKLLSKNNIGVTEFLAKKCNVKNNSEVMLITNEELSVSPITTHINIKQVSSKIKSVSIINKAKTIDLWFKKKFKRRPKIAILGLNPHNGEFKKKSEEIKTIKPSIMKLKKLGLKVKGPIVSDTVFINDYKNYDVIIGMFHDQVLTPFKALFKFNAINITLGLKYLRISPDHGTALDLVGKNKADPTSLLKCISYVSKCKE
jgi:4-hydroxy-L-threonine phosphate dehydrogenase PdxA